ncbi:MULTISPECIES: Crp/Fnr family transcriptional regulator [Streptomyces]|uniref:Crp/Fnr family transcriptional regulator n=1 Tax=Streptomyces arenae TaxID=29301 RepID=UPI002659504D|nr:Crp/Fnr family transcriptional regulator [Streptomyces arenae]MCG7205005.1 Crp/Fnr family transcriptional regulator [Streptomyces arenae]
MAEGGKPGPFASWAPGSYLGQLSDGARRTLLQAGTLRSYAAGDVLFREGDPSSYLLMIAEGLVKVSAAAPTGQETLLAIRGPGDVIGELSALGRNPLRSATVIAAGRVTATILANHVFLQLAETHPELATAMIRVLSAKLREASVARVEVHTYGVRVRLARVLLSLAASLGRRTEHGTVLELPLTQPELAALVSASPRSVARALQEFRDGGLIDIGYRRVLLRDPEALTEAAHG